MNSRNRSPRRQSGGVSPAARRIVLTIVTLLYIGMSVVLVGALERDDLLADTIYEPVLPGKDAFVSEFDYPSMSDLSDGDLFLSDGDLLSDSDMAPPLSGSDMPKIPEELADVILEANFESKYYIVVYVGSQSVCVYGKNEEGAYANLVKSFTCSTGLEETPTEPGVYHIKRKYRWEALMGDLWGQYCCSIGNGYLFHSVPYRERDESMMNMTMYRNLGKRASHGCIRLCVADAYWLYKNVPYKTQVSVVERAGPEGAGVAPLDYSSTYWGWDPTDIWCKRNPYHYTVTTTTTTTATTADGGETSAPAASTSVPSASTEATTTTTAATTTTTTTAAPTTTTTTAAPAEPNGENAE